MNKQPRYCGCGEFLAVAKRPSPGSGDGRHRKREPAQAYSSLSSSIIEAPWPLRLREPPREELLRPLLRELEPRLDALRELEPPRLLALRELPPRLEPALRLREPLREPLDCDDLGICFSYVCPGWLIRRAPAVVGGGGRVKFAAGFAGSIFVAHGPAIGRRAASVMG
jgi:hypothetical protein